MPLARCRSFPPPSNKQTNKQTNNAPIDCMEDSNRQSNPIQSHPPDAHEVKRIERRMLRRRITQHQPTWPTLPIGHPPSLRRSLVLFALLPSPTKPNEKGPLRRTQKLTYNQHYPTKRGAPPRFVLPLSRHIRVRRLGTQLETDPTTTTQDNPRLKLATQDNPKQKLENTHTTTNLIP